MITIIIFMKMGYSVLRRSQAFMMQLKVSQKLLEIFNTHHHQYFTVQKPCFSDSGSGLVWTRGYDKILIGVLVRATKCDYNDDNEEKSFYLRVECKLVLLYTNQVTTIFSNIICSFSRLDMQNYQGL